MNLLTIDLTALMCRSNVKDVCNIRVRSHERRNELIQVWDFKSAWKQILFTCNFISAAFQNDPIIWWTIGISFRVVFTWHSITRNEISLLSKWPTWNPWPHLVSKAHAHQTEHLTSLHLFISFHVNYVHMKISCQFEISFRSKWPIWNPCRLEFQFASIYVNTSKELT